MPIRVEARSHSAISVVNALATGFGATIGIDIQCRVVASLKRKQRDALEVRSEYKDSHNLIGTCVDYTLNTLKAKIPNDKTLELRIESDIPPAVGLKSSSAVSVAVVKAVSALFGAKLNEFQILRVSCQASKQSGASITGAYDDASASLLGGLVMTNNKKFQILKHARVPANLGNIALLLVPKLKKRFTSSVNISVYEPFKEESRKAFEYAMHGEIAEAMIVNSIIQCSALKYPFEPISFALSAKATAAGITGKGPAVAALCSSRAVANRIKKAWAQNHRSEFRIITTRIVQPSKTISSKG